MRGVLCERCRAVARRRAAISRPDRCQRADHLCRDGAAGLASTVPRHRARSRLESVRPSDGGPFYRCDLPGRSPGHSGPDILPDILASVLLIGFLVTPGFVFGQREHLAAMALAPYAVCRAGMNPALPEIGFRTVVGVIAGNRRRAEASFRPDRPRNGISARLASRQDLEPGLETILMALTAGACAVATLVLLP